MVRVRDSFPILSCLPVAPNSRYSETVFRDIVDSDASSARGFDESVPLVEPTLSCPKAPDISLGNDNGIARPNAEPIVKICPPTPLKRPSKSGAITGTDAEEQRACVVAERKTAIKGASSYDESQSPDAPSKNSIMPHDGSGDGKVYSKETCPFHRHEPAVKIFDDDIEIYLIDDPRASVSPNQKFSEWPLPRATPKYRGTEGKITSANKIRAVTSPQKKLEYQPDDMDLTASEITSGEFKDNENDAPYNKREIKLRKFDSQSDILSSASDLKIASYKESKTANKSKIMTLLPELFQSRNKIKATLGKLMMKSRKTREYPETCKIQDKLIDKAE